MAHKRMDVEAKEVRRVNAMDLGRIDVDFVNRGGALIIDGPDGVFYKTAEIVEYEKARDGVYAKDIDGVVYTSRHRYANRFMREIEERLGISMCAVEQAYTPRVSPMEKHMIDIAGECLAEGKELGVIKNFDANNTVFVNDRRGLGYYMDPELIEAITEIGKKIDLERFNNPAIQRDVVAILKKHGFDAKDWNWARKECGMTLGDVRNGLHIQLQNCTVEYSDGQSHDTFIDIPRLDTFAHSNGELFVDSKDGFRYTTVEGCMEKYKDMRDALEQKHDANSDHTYEHCGR